MKIFFLHRNYCKKLLCQIANNCKQKTLFQTFIRGILLYCYLEKFPALLCSALQRDLRSHKDLNKDYEDKIEVLEGELKKINELFTDTQQELGLTCEQLQETQANFQATRQKLKKTNKMLKEKTIFGDEQQYLVHEVDIQNCRQFRYPANEQ